MRPVGGVRELLEVITFELEADAPLLRVIIEQVPHAGGPMASARPDAAWPSRAAPIWSTTSPLAELRPLVFPSICVRIALDRPPGIGRTALLDHALRVITTWYRGHR